MTKPCNAATYRAATIKLATAEAPKIVVEVGVYQGALSRMFAAMPSVEEMHIIDSWDGSYCKFGRKHMDYIAAIVIDWAKTDPKVFVDRVDSLVGAKLFDDESIDFWHTDGDHTLAGIRGDIEAWLPKVKPGCIMSGDNYEIPDVAQGVREFFPDHKLLALGRLWWARK